MKLRDAWSIITADDYDRHMAAIGQAQANADILRELFETRRPAIGAAILFAGAGTGQMFDFISPDFLRPFSTTFTDVNEHYLRKLRGRLSSCAGIRAHVAVDDIENSALSGKFALVIAVLVLEHVDVARAVATMCCLAAELVFVVLQENPTDLARGANARARRVHGGIPRSTASSGQFNGNRALFCRARLLLRVDHVANRAGSEEDGGNRVQPRTLMVANICLSF